MRRYFLLCLRAVVVLYFLASTARADQVQLANGDRVTGKLVALDKHRLQFRTARDEALSFPRKDVVAIVVEGEVTVLFINGVRTTGRLQTGLAGQMQLHGGQVDPWFWFSLDAIATLHAGSPQAQSAVRWSGRVDLGIEVEGGNSDTDSVEIDGRVTGVWSKHRLVATADIDYERANGEATVQAAEGTLRHDRFVSEKLFFFTTVFWEHDKFKELNLRALPATGPGYQFFKGEDRNFSIKGGPGLLYENYKGDTDDRTDPALYWQYDYDQFLYERFMQFFHNHIGFLNVANTNEAVFKFRWGLRFPMRWGFVATTQFELDHETDPEPGTKKTDHTFKLTLGYQW